MLTNQIYNQQLAFYAPHYLSPEQIKMEANLDHQEYAQMNREISPLGLHNSNTYGFDQNNNSDENSRIIIDDMLLYKSYYATTQNLNTCLAIDCTLAQNQLTPTCLSSSSSTTSTSSSSTSINTSEVDTLTKVTINSQDTNNPPNHLKNYNLKKNNFIFKNVNKNLTPSSVNSPCTSSSSECLSSDEGYVGSYSENYESNKKRQVQLYNQHQNLILYLYNNGLLYPNLIEQSQDDENINIEIPALFEVENKSDENISNLLVNDDQVEIETNLKIFPKDSEIKEIKNVLFEDLSASFLLDSTEEIEKLSQQVLNEKKDEENLDECEMATTNWRKIVEKRKLNEIKSREFSLEDECDLNAYLNEIDMNLDYSQLDQIYLNSKMIFLDVDQFLKFRNNKMAFNLRKYHEYLLEEKKPKAMKFLFENLHVDSIPEFVPIIENEANYCCYDDNYEIESNEYDMNEHYAQHDDAEYTMIDGELNEENFNKEDSPNYLFDTTVTPHELDDMESTPALEYDYQTEEYEDYDDQVYIDSLTEEEAIALLRNESEIYALQMAQASKYGLLGENTQKTSKKSKSKSRFNSGHTDDLSKTDIFENVFNFDDENFDVDHYDYTDEIYIEEGGYAQNSNISASLRNSLLKLRKQRRHLTRLLNLNSTKNNSNGSTTPSSTTSSLTTSHLGLYKQHIVGQSKKPCMYMLTEGRCLRSDCRFVHDLKTITCKYWLEGECLKGDNCEFLHEIVECDQYSVKSHNKVSSSFKSKKELKAKKDFKLDTEEFPALGLSTTKQASPKSKPVSLANVVKKNPQKKDKIEKVEDKIKEEKKAKKSEHKARGGKSVTSSNTPVIQITLKPSTTTKQSKKANSCGNSSVTSSGSSSATSSRANSKIRSKK
ncbi:unnamed protein product [Brachionus calyciflorus]|uniref:C3H1-type domain-containing protein n=1 Tax=Brachionus calyciflorus TaxID=104777 RepID=A0A813P2V9_9BILA|nr:unnamed protein product [Brachionus calyciflorus]